MRKDYATLLKQAEALVENETDAIANAANLASLIYHGVEQINWAGFYFRKDRELVLGPFCGQVACTRIEIGKGVCGTAFQQQELIVVNDVHKFEGHIACDAASESELVVPFNQSGLAGVLDIDSPIKNRFGNAEIELFTAITQLYKTSSFA